MLQIMDRAEHDNCLLVIVPYDCGDFYVSGTFHLCCRSPLRATVLQDPVMPYVKVNGLASHAVIQAVELQPDYRENVLILSKSN